MDTVAPSTTITEFPSSPRPRAPPAWCSWPQMMRPAAAWLAPRAASMAASGSPAIRPSSSAAWRTARTPSRSAPPIRLATSSSPSRPSPGRCSCPAVTPRRRPRVRPRVQRPARRPAGRRQVARPRHNSWRDDAGHHAGGTPRRRDHAGHDSRHHACTTPGATTPGTTPAGPRRARRRAGPRRYDAGRDDSGYDAGWDDAGHHTGWHDSGHNARWDHAGHDPGTTPGGTTPAPPPARRRSARSRGMVRASAVRRAACPVPASSRFVVRLARGGKVSSSRKLNAICKLSADTVRACSVKLSVKVGRKMVAIGTGKRTNRRLGVRSLG